MNSRKNWKGCWTRTGAARARSSQEADRGNMKESLGKAHKIVIRLFQFDVWVENLLFLLVIFFLFGYALYLGWLSFHQH
jgi:hypothetical protein